MNSRKSRRSFTLIELLVVMGIIAVLAGVTALGYRSVAQDAKMSSAKNTIMAVLDAARGQAMKNNEIVCVAFRAKLDGKIQHIELITAKWSRQTASVVVGQTPGQVIDRFIPIPGAAVRRLPIGIQVAGPSYGGLPVSANCQTQYDPTGADLDSWWITCSNLPTIIQSGADAGKGEKAGHILAVMYSPDGRTITRNSTTDSARMWIDFNNDGLQQMGGGADTNYFSVPPPVLVVEKFNSTPDAGDDKYPLFFDQRFDTDEPYIDCVPFLCVIDDEHARSGISLPTIPNQFCDPKSWTTMSAGSFAQATCQRSLFYKFYITNNADRIHFNRYTGVARR